MLDRVIVPLDGSALAECVLPHAVAVASALAAQVTLVRVLEQADLTSRARPVDPLDWHIRKAEAGTYLGRVTSRLQQAGLRVEEALLEGQPAESIVQFIRDRAIGLVMLSSHGRSGLSGWNVSSVVQKIILRAYIPTMIIRAYHPVAAELAELRYRRLLVPLDCSQRAECVLPLAATLARFHGAELLLVHVVSRPEMPRRAPPSHEDAILAERLMSGNRREAEKYLEQVRSSMASQGVEARTRLDVSEDADGTLHDLVDEENADVVVLSAHGYSARKKWPFGSLVTGFIAYGTTPLLIVQDLALHELEPSQAEMAAKELRGH